MKDVVERLLVIEGAGPCATPSLARLAADEITKLRAENEALRAALKPFATWENRDFDEKKGDGILYQRAANGKYCIPDSHGYECVWSDEADGGTVEFTAGQFRRARAAFTDGQS